MNAKLNKDSVQIAIVVFKTCQADVCGVWYNTVETRRYNFVTCYFFANFYKFRNESCMCNGNKYSKEMMNF